MGPDASLLALESSIISLGIVSLSAGSSFSCHFTFATQALLPQLKQNGRSRIVWVTSSAEAMNTVDFEDLE